MSDQNASANSPAREQYFPGQDELQDARRAGAARQSYIVWRMQDLPSVYTDLMPFTPDVAELWVAEKNIRRQYEEDQKLAASPWRVIGPKPHLLDYSNLKGRDLFTFAIECEPMMLMPGVVKRGFEKHPDVIAALKAAQEHPVMKLERERGELVNKIAANNSASDSLTSDEVDAARARIVAIEAEVKLLTQGELSTLSNGVLRWWPTPPRDE